MDKRRVDGILKDFASKAIRVIAVAIAEPIPSAHVATFKNLKLVGLLGIRDDVREESVKGIQQVQSAGIQTVMITGDSPVTAQAIAKEVGIIRTDSDIVITSDELSRLSDEEISRLLPRIKVIARALPSDKSRLVRIAQAKDLVVGMTGDGVNDAPALKQADIGFAMGSGTEVAKEAGDIVILDDNILSIAKAIRYGRTIFKSIRKFIIYQLSISMCAAGVTVIAPLMGVDFPITIIQMLWINIVMDTLAGMAFSGEKAREKYMKEPPKKRNEPILNGYMKVQIAVNSIYTTILCLFFLRSPIFRQLVGTEGYVYQMTAFFALFMFIAIFTSFCARTHHINLLEYLASNKAFLFIMGIVTIIQINILYFGGTVFRTVTLDPNDVLLVVVLAMTIFPIDFLRKLILSKFVGVKGT